MLRFDLDIRGQICPSALLTALREVNRCRTHLKEKNLILQVLTDSRNATVTIPEAVGNMGYQVAVEKEEGHYVIRIMGHAGGGLESPASR